MRFASERNRLVYASISSVTAGKSSAGVETSISMRSFSKVGQRLALESGRLKPIAKLATATGKTRKAVLGDLGPLATLAKIPS
ncbi:MAG: hypothetical protein QM765_40935 [Myxococcales bacterium]